MKLEDFTPAYSEYRYHLSRAFDDGEGKVLFIMLNPSTATQDADDPTIRRCMGFAKRWGYRFMEVVNLFALRATMPQDLKKAGDPVGPENDKHILDAIFMADKVVCAWGSHGVLHGRDQEVSRLLHRICEPLCFGTNSNGTPKHPLYQKTDQPLILFGRGE